MTLQKSPFALPCSDAATATAVCTTAPLVGRPIADARDRQIQQTGTRRGRQRCAVLLGQAGNGKSHQCERDEQVRGRQGPMCHSHIMPFARRSHGTLRTSLTQSRAWVLARRPLLLALVLGLGISLLASGRFTIRLSPTARCRLPSFPSPSSPASRWSMPQTPGAPFRDAVDRFFAGTRRGCGGWLAIMTAALCSLSREQDQPAGAAARRARSHRALGGHDLRFFRDAMGAHAAAPWSTSRFSDGLVVGRDGVFLRRRDRRASFFYQFGYLFVEMWDDRSAGRGVA